MPITRSRKKAPRVLATSVAALLGLAAAAFGNSATWLDVGNDWANNANWTDAFPNATGDVATFDTAAAFVTPTINTTPITVAQILFNAAAPSYTITLDGTASTTSLTFAGAGVTNNSAVTQNFTAGASGGNTATIVFSGSASAGTNTNYTLNSGGVMQFTGTSSGGTAVIVNNAGGLFDISGQSGGVTVNSISGAGNISLGGNTLTTGGDNSTGTISGVISGSGGGLTKTGTGTLTLTGGNTYTGTTTISDGTLALSGAGTLSNATPVNVSGATGIFDISAITATGETVGSLAGVAGSSVVLGGKNLTLANNNTTTFAGVISGAGGSLTKQGAGNLTLTGANTYSGPTTIAGGVLTLSGNGTLAATSAVNLTDASSGFDISGMTATSETIASLAGVANSEVSLGSNTLIVGGDNSSTTFAGILFGTGGGLTKQGTGTMTLTGSNLYTGSTTIAGGTLKLSAGGALSDSTAVSITSPTGVFDMSGITATTQTVGSLAGVTGSSVVLGAKNLTAGGDNTTTTFAGVISGTGGSLTKVGTGTMTLSGPNTYTGATTVNGGGKLIADTTTNATVLSSSSALVLSGSTFQLTGSPGNARVQIVNGLTINSGDSSIVINNTGISTTLDMRGTSGTQGITRNGNGSVDFRALGGTFSVDAIVLTGQQNNASGMIGVWATVNNGSAFAANDGTGKIVAFNNYVDINALGPNTVPNDPNANVRINALGTAGPVPISQPTTNINTLTQNFTTASTIDTSPGLLRFGVNGGILIASGKAALTIGTAPNSGRITAGGNTSNVAGELTLNNMSASTLTINSAITDNGTGVVSVTKVGSGLAVFAGTNTYTGNTTIAEGTLSLVGAGSLADTGGVNLSGATANFNISGITASSETIGALAGVAGSNVVLGAKNLTVGGDGFSTTYAGTITGATGSLTKSGTGSLDLSGNNSYGGGTTLAGGTLITDSNNALGTGTLTITATGTGTTLGSSVQGIVLPNPVSVKGDFSIGTAASDYTLAGSVNLNGGTRTITGFNTTNQIHFSGGITNGALTLATTLSGTGNYIAFIMDPGNVNTYTGLTTINSGAFFVIESTAANGAIAGNVLIQGNGVLDYLGTQSEQIADNATVTVNSTGNFAAGAQFTGMDLFNAAGTETIATLNGTGSVGLAAATLKLNDGNFSGTIIDGFHGISGGTLLKTSTGTLTLSGVNTFNGTASISDGTIALTGGGTLTNATVNIAATGILDVSGVTTSTTVGELTSTSATASVVLGSKTLNAGQNNSSTAFAGVISGTGGLTKVGTGTLTLTGVNTYTGVTTVNAGTLQVSLATNPSVIDHSSTLAVGGGTFELTGVSGSAKTQVMNGLTVNAGSSSIVINNGADAAGTVTTLDLRGPSGTAGITHVAGGSVDFRSIPVADFQNTAIVLTGQANDASGILGSYATVNNGAAFAANDGTGKIVAYTGYTDIAARGPASVIPDSPNANVRINSPGTTGPITLASPTTIINTLSQNNAQAAVVDLAGETLKVGATGGIFITPSGGNLTIGTAPNSGTLTSGGVTATGSGEVILGNFNTGSTLTINSVISNNGVVGVVALTKTGAGTVVLAGQNTYRGATTIGAGRLSLTGVGSITNTSAVSLTGGTSVLDITGISAANTTIGSLDGVLGSSVVLGGKELITGGNNNSTTFAGIISGSGGKLTKVGSGTMTLTGANTYDGLTTVDGGSLVLNTTGANAIAGNVLIDSGSVVLQQSNQIADSKTVTVDGGSFIIGANSETVGGVSLKMGTIEGTTGVLISGTTFDVRSGTITANLSSTSDSVGLTKTTGGTVILAGQNTYHGPTNVQGGVLILDGTINFGTNGVNVTNGSEFDTTTNGVVVTGDGVNVVTATDGNTINNAGLLQGGKNAIGIIAANNNQITNSGAIVGGAVGFTGVKLTGSGNFVSNAGFISGDKAVVLTNGAGANQVVNYGTLQGNGGIAIDSTASGGDLTVTQDGDVNGNIRFGSGNDTMTLVTLKSVNGTIDGGTGANLLRLVGSFSDTLDIGSDYTTNFQTLYKGGGGTWTLTGEGTFTGGTTVNMGKLYVEGNLISDVLVQQMGFLGGTGTITGNLTNFGTVSPGNSPGTMTVKGNYTQGSTGNLTIQIAGTKAGQYDILKIGGHAQLAGTLTIDPSKSSLKFKMGDKVTFLVADGGVDGKFQNVVNPLGADTIIQTGVVYSSNSVSLEAQQGSYEEYAKNHNFTPNQIATAHAVDGSAFAGKNQPMVDYLNKERLTKLPADLDRIAPEELGSVYRVGIGLAGVQNTNIQRRTDDLRLSNRRVNTDGFQANGATPGFSGGLNPTGAQGPDGQSPQPQAAPAKEPDRRWGAFLTGMGDWIRIGDTENARGYNFETGGTTVGVDFRATDHFAVGASAGYAGTGTDLAQGGKMRVNSGKLGVYATYWDKGFYADAAVSGGYNNYDTARAGLSGMARGKTDGEEINAMLGGGYDWSLDSLTLGALTSVEYTYLNFGAFTEHGSLAPLDVAGQHGQSFRTKLGAKAAYDWQLGTRILRPEARVVWQHEFGDQSFGIDSQLAGGAGTPFTVHDSVVGRDSLLLGLGATMVWTPRAATYLFYDGEIYRKESESHNVTGGVRISF